MQQQPREEENKERESGEASNFVQQQAHASCLTGRLRSASFLLRLFFFLKKKYWVFFFFNSKKNCVLWSKFIGIILLLNVGFIGIILFDESK